MVHRRCDNIIYKNRSQKSNIRCVKKNINGIIQNLIIKNVLQKIDGTICFKILSNATYAILK